MSMRFSGAEFRRLVFGFGLAGLLVFHEGLAQQTVPPVREEQARQLWNTKFRSKRPLGARPTSGTADTTGRPSPASAPNVDAIMGAGEDALVGITFWRLRDSRADDDQEVRFSERGRNTAWTPERVEAEAPLAAGENVRVGIETTRSGYLYVVDREQYADGTFSTPVLIFPTARTRSSHSVTAGRLIEIPSWEANPPYFTLRMSRPDQVAEVLTVLVVPEPLPDLQLGEEPARLTAEQLRDWERRWGASSTRLGARAQVGMAYTKAEKEAGSVRARLLTQEDPLPQTIFSLKADPGDPLLVNVRLPIVR